MLLRESTKNYQSDLSNYCRTGTYTTIPGVKEKHVTQYRRLIYNIIDDNLETAFPLTKNVLKPKEWDTFVQFFFENHACQSPQVWQMPKEVFDFYSTTPHPITKRYPFLTELLYFEWMEVFVHMMPDITYDTFKTAGDFTKDKIVVNPELEIIPLTYPVHLKNAKKITLTDKGNFYVSLHREPETGRVIFTNLSYPFVQLLNETYSNEINYAEAIELLKNYGTQAQAEKAFADFTSSALERKLYLGYQP